MLVGARGVERTRRRIIRRCRRFWRVAGVERRRRTNVQFCRRFRRRMAGLLEQTGGSAAPGASWVVEQTKTPRWSKNNPPGTGFFWRTCCRSRRWVLPCPGRRFSSTMYTARKTERSFPQERQRGRRSPHKKDKEGEDLHHSCGANEERTHSQNCARSRRRTRSHKLWRIAQRTRSPKLERMAAPPTQRTRSPKL